MVSARTAFLVIASMFLIFAPAVALCEATDAIDIEIEEVPDVKEGFSFGQQPENNTLTVVVLIILTLILIAVLILLLKLRKKMNDGHY